MNPEYIQHKEKMAKKNARGASGEPQFLTDAVLEEIVADRNLALASVEGYLPLKLKTKIKEKLEWERAALHACLERQKAARKASQRSIPILHRAYFKQKMLDTTGFD